MTVSTPGVVCLQGGREFTSACEEMDTAVLDQVDGRVVVLAGAARVGQDYAGAVRRATRHYAALGASAVGAPDPRVDLAGTLRAMQDVGLLVLPGGSPSSLRDVLTGPVADRVHELHVAGTGLSGASAGAMVLCARTSLPDRGGDVVDGLGIAPGIASVHWRGDGPAAGRGPRPRWGLPECGGVLITTDASGHRAVRALGQGQPSISVDASWRQLPRDTTIPLAHDLG